MSIVDCHPMSVVPGLSRLFLDFCAPGAEEHARLKPFFGSLPAENGWTESPARPAHWPDLVRLLAAQNNTPAAAESLAALNAGAGVMVTGQQVGLFGGPLFTPLKAATALARARQATAAGKPHRAIFWLATEDHDFAEINHVTFPQKKALTKLVYETLPDAAQPVGSLVLDGAISPLVDQAWELLGASDAMDALAAAYQPGKTWAQAFAEFYGKLFAPQGLLILDASGRDLHRIGAPVLRAAIELADELHAVLLERNRELEAAGYHTQVAVADHSSPLFLIDDRTGARVALKRTPPHAAEPDGLWHAGKQPLTTNDLLGILSSQPERISPAALLRPVFQDFLLGTSATIGGPAEIAYFAQSSVLFDRILGRRTPALPRFSATLIEPAIGDLLRKHELTLDRVFQENAATLAQLLAARQMPVEGKQKLAAAGLALDAELDSLLAWTQSVDVELARSTETAASKMRYQMNRLRTNVANFQLAREASLGKHAAAISQALYPEGGLQERLHGAAYYFARYGFELAEELTRQATQCASAHASIWL